MTDDTALLDEVFADLDRAGPIPLYFQVSTRLEAAIRSGRLTPGARLANEISIAERLGVSRPTIRRAIQEVVNMGLLVRRRGIGTQVVQGQVTRAVELTSLYEDLKVSHQDPGTRVITLETRPATKEVAEALTVDPGSEVVFLRRERLTNGVPIAILTNHLPLRFADISIEQLETQGLYQLLRSRGVVIRVARQRIGARRADRDEAERLGIENGDPVLTMDRVAFDASGKAVEHGSHCYRPDMYSFETTLVAK